VWEPEGKSFPLTLMAMIRMQHRKCFRLKLFCLLKSANEQHLTFFSGHDSGVAIRKQAQMQYISETVVYTQTAYSYFTQTACSSQKHLYTQKLGQLLTYKQNACSFDTDTMLIHTDKPKNFISVIKLKLFLHQ
jgi:hypothetical protein